MRQLWYNVHFNTGSLPDEPHAPNEVTSVQATSPKQAREIVLIALREDYQYPTVSEVVLTPGQS